MPRKSAGILLYRRCRGQLQVFLAHMGGPFWAHRDDGAWSIPKGEFLPEEDPFDAARREFHEEIGTAVEGEFIELEPIRQAGGKIVFAWALEGECDPDTICSNTYDVEWPRGSGKWRSYPEIDRAAWFPLQDARVKILRGQAPLLDQLERLVSQE